MAAVAAGAGRGRRAAGVQARAADPPPARHRISLRYAGAWQELVDTARDLGLTVPTRGSRPAQAVVLGEVLLDLARTADDAVFGPSPPSVESAESYWRAVLESRAHLGADLPWWRRLLAPFSPASLR